MVAASHELQPSVLQGLSRAFPSYVNHARWMQEKWERMAVGSHGLQGVLALQGLKQARCVAAHSLPLHSADFSVLTPLCSGCCLQVEYELMALGSHGRRRRSNYADALSGCRAPCSTKFSEAPDNTGCWLQVSVTTWRLAATSCTRRRCRACMQAPWLEQAHCVAADRPAASLH